ncbi:hypothetical protein [Methanolapillus ohkumae]|uniref:Uncharacterized protein n=1 Tax=Methanolapillus ohkumae TaxID=3028298 RepID=A0AA96V8C5_9EURY|nr:hypothetical protein MsAm2_15220 [Methanosarcinaceae archaeon Am2]
MPVPALLLSHVTVAVAAVAANIVNFANVINAVAIVNKYNAAAACTKTAMELNADMK